MTKRASKMSTQERAEIAERNIESNHVEDIAREIRALRVEEKL